MYRVATVCLFVLCFWTVLYVLSPRLYPDFQSFKLSVENKMEHVKSPVSNYSGNETIFIGATICGNPQQIGTALIMMKSAIVFRGKLHVHFLIACSQSLQKEVHSELEMLKVKVGNVFTYEIRDPFFPKGNETFWRFWFKECATERLFFPNIFPEVRLIVYVDNDVLFLNELSDLWQHAFKMNRSQMIAAGPDYLDLEFMAKEKNSKHPLNKAPSLNAGVLILDTKKLAEFGWLIYLQKMADIYSNILPYADQDLIRLTVLFHPDKLYPLSCKYNFHTFLCGSKIHCKDVETDGISVLHGCTHGFTDDVQFKSIYDAFKEFRTGVDSKTHLLALWNNTLEKMGNKFCQMSTTAIANNIQKALSTD